MSLDSLLTAIGTEFKSSLGTRVKKLDEHAGSFDPRQFLEFKSFASPAVFYGVTNIQDGAVHPDDAIILQAYDGNVMSVQCTVMCIGRHAKSRVAANREARLSALTLLNTLRKQDFDLPYLGNARKSKAVPVAYAKQDKSRLAFWRLEWWHSIALNGEALEAAWAELEQWAGWDGDHHNQEGESMMKTTVDHIA